MKVGRAVRLSHVALAMGLWGDALSALLDGAAIDGESVAPSASLVGQGVGPAPFKVLTMMSLRCP